MFLGALRWPPQIVIRYPAEASRLRSVFAHLWHTTEGEVSTALDRLYPTQGRPWVLEVDGDPCLYIDFYRDGPVEDDEWGTRFTSHGGPPAVSVIADISGRHEGWPEVRSSWRRVSAPSTVSLRMTAGCVCGRATKSRKTLLSLVGGSAIGATTAAERLPDNHALERTGRAERSL